MAKKSNKNGKRSKVPSSKKKSIQKVGNAGRAQVNLSQPTNPTFGAVSTINTAPVAIGNSLRGAKTSIVHTPTGCIVTGRDFGFSPVATGNVTSWVLVGGCPITPFCFASSVLRNAASMYARFKCRSLVLHYITSSSTSTTGDVMFYVRRNEGSVLPLPTGNTFLPYVLSDALTVIGPQWTNHSMVIDTNQMPWLNSDYGATPKLNTYNQYDAFLYSKTSSTESPGYVILDYSFEFKEVSISPRSGALATIASTKAQWNQVAFTLGTNATAGTTVATITAYSTTGIGATSITAPSPTSGDVYEFVVDVSNSTFSAATAANCFQYSSAEVFQAFTLTDGQIFYVVTEAGTTVHFYTSLEAAVSNSAAIRFGATVQYAETLRGFWKLVTSISPAVQVFS